MTISPLFSLEIPRHLNDERIDRACADLMKEKLPEQEPLSRAKVTRLINDGSILLNGQPVLSRALVATHDLLTFSQDIFAKQEELEPLQEDITIPVLFEQEHFLILDKPAGIQMHHGGSLHRGTVAQWILKHYPALALVGGDAMRPGIVHRLDRDTSGIIVIAKDDDTFVALKDAFQNRTVEKTYIALVSGHLPNLSGEVSASLIRKPGELKRRAIDTETYTGTLPGNTRTAFTAYRVLARYEDYDLVELSPKTGRTHQLRVHMAFLGHPVVGDRLYAFKQGKKETALQPARHLLHAARISFTVNDEHWEFFSPLSPDFREVLKSLDETLVSSYDDEALKSLF